MNSSFKHIGLQVIEPDIKNFYTDILNFKLKYSFQLSKKDCMNIFEIEKEITILSGECDELEMELFVVETKQKPSYGHVCFYSGRLTEIAKIATKKDYKIFYRGTKDNETIFIKDLNNNLFEIKHLIKKTAP